MIMAYTISYTNDNGIYSATVEPLNAGGKNLFNVVFEDWKEAREAACAVSKMADTVQDDYQCSIRATCHELQCVVDKICAEIKEAQMDTPTALETFVEKLKAEIEVDIKAALW